MIYLWKIPLLYDFPIKITNEISRLLSSFRENKLSESLSPMLNLNACTAAVSYVASYSWTISKPSLIKNYTKFFQLPVRFLILDTPFTNKSIASHEGTLSRLSVLEQASHSTSKVSTNSDQALHLPNRKIILQSSNWCLNLLNHSSSRTVNLDFCLAKLDDLSGIQLRTKRTKEKLSATS